LPLIANVTIVPSDALAGTKYAAAEILIPPTNDRFPDPFIYVSNRNIGTTIDPRGDSVAIFRFVPASTSTYKKRFARRSISQRVANDATEGSLELVAQVFTGLQQIRGMMFGREVDGGDEFLVASGNIGEGGVVVFKRVDGGKSLVEVARNTEALTRSTFVFV
jgi:hypothetical protein